MYEFNHFLKTKRNTKNKLNLTSTTFQGKLFGKLDPTVLGSNSVSQSIQEGPT